MTLSRDRLDVLLEHWSALSRHGVLNVDGLFAWRATPYGGKLSARERAWDAIVCRPQDSFNNTTMTSQSSECVILKSMGLVKHGLTISKARADRNQTIRDADQLIDREAYCSYTGTQIDMDVERDPIDTDPYDQLSASAMRLMRRPFTARQVLRNIVITSKRAYDIPYDIRSAVSVMRDDRERIIDAEQAAAKRKEAVEKMLSDLESHRRVRVSVKHAQAAGFCELGTTGWLRSNFPDILPTALRKDTVKDYSKVFNIRRTVSVGQILDLPVAERDMALRAAQIAIDESK